MSGADDLERALIRAGVLTSTEAVRTAVRAGRLKVGGRPVKSPLMLVPEGAKVSLDGVPVSLFVPMQVAVFHKPRNCVSTRAVDRRGRPNVFELFMLQIPHELVGLHWHAVGRLDVDTTGLLLFATHETFVTHASSPESRLPKRYVAEVSGEINAGKLARLGQSMTLEGGLRTLPAKAERRGEKSVVVTLIEGKYHQVKRMLGEVGLPTTRLHREAVGTLELDIPEGEARLLTSEEVQEKLGFRNV